MQCGNGSPLGAARHNIKMHKLQLSQSGLTDQWHGEQNGFLGNLSKYLSS